MPSAQTSAIPATIDALVALLRAAPALAGVTVVDGKRAGTASSDKDRLFIGASPDDEPAVTGTQDWAGSPGQERDETFDVMCAAESWTGDTDVKARRDRAFAIVAAVEQLLRPGATGSNFSLGVATLLWAHVSGSIGLSYQQTKRGVVAQVRFMVRVRARLDLI